MPDYDYVNEQLQRLTPVDEYGIQIKLTSTTGETKWMTLTKENQQEHLRTFKYSFKIVIMIS
jgi:hypothetical protein